MIEYSVYLFSYKGEAMRRKDREIVDIDEIKDIVDRCDICRIALNNDGYPYILPLNFGVDVENESLTLYFHSALEGYKLELFKKDNRASFEMDCNHKLEYFEERGYCTYSYESVIGRGHIVIIEDEQEKFKALEILMDHYHPGKKAWFNPAAIPRTAVYKLVVEALSAKRKEVKKREDH